MRLDLSLPSPAVCVHYQIAMVGLIVIHLPIYEVGFNKERPASSIQTPFLGLALTGGSSAA